MGEISWWSTLNIFSRTVGLFLKENAMSNPKWYYPIRTSKVVTWPWRKKLKSRCLATSLAKQPETCAWEWGGTEREKKFLIFIWVKIAFESQARISECSETAKTSKKRQTILHGLSPFQTFSTRSVVIIPLYCTLLDVLDSRFSFHKHPNKTRINSEWWFDLLFRKSFASLWLLSWLDCNDIRGTRNIKHAARKEMPPQE